jgi:hypothetical protein
VSRRGNIAITHGVRLECWISEYNYCAALLAQYYEPIARLVRFPAALLSRAIYASVWCVAKITTGTWVGGTRSLVPSGPAVNVFRRETLGVTPLEFDLAIPIAPLTYV